MIPYSTRSFQGIQLLFQINGSSLYRSACIQGLLSLILFIIIRKIIIPSSFSFSSSSKTTTDPFVMEILILSVTLLIVFRVNYSYERYWSACGHVHQMMSLWMDAATNAFVFYMQQSHHDVVVAAVGGSRGGGGGIRGSFKPPNYFDAHDLNRYGLSRDRQLRSGMSSSISSSCKKQQKLVNVNQEEVDEERGGDDDLASRFPIISPSAMTISELHDMDETSLPTNGSFSFSKLNATATTTATTKMPSIFHKEGQEETVKLLNLHRRRNSTIDNPRYLIQSPRLDGGWASAFPNDVDGNTDGRSTYYHGLPQLDTMVKINPRGFASDAGGRTPSLYLQELVHLASLCSAVALATLRHYTDDNDASRISKDCFCIHNPGEPWPEVDSSKIGLQSSTYYRIMTILESIILEECDTRPGIRQSQHAARPIPILGGISQNELLFLSRSKGSSAKVQLAWSWFTEFMTREDLAGSFGGIGSPIISNIHASLSEGMVHYNHCRKIMFMPFPFPHAQISAAFIIAIMVIVPILSQEYVNSTILGGVITFLSVTCLAGLHEVARELENPFDNVPNEIPLTVLQAMFNDALITVFAGFHPDHYWNADDYRNLKSQ